jgi:hypothetical protein
MQINSFYRVEYWLVVLWLTSTVLILPSMLARFRCTSGFSQIPLTRALVRLLGPCFKTGWESTWRGSAADWSGQELLEHLGPGTWGEPRHTSLSPRRCCPDGPDARAPTASRRGQWAFILAQVWPSEGSRALTGVLERLWPAPRQKQPRSLSRVLGHLTQRVVMSYQGLEVYPAAALDPGRPVHPALPFLVILATKS